VAERTVNVTINYKVNTAEVQKAQQASQQAQRATEELRKSAQNYGTQAARAHKQAGDAARMNAKDVHGLDQNFNSLYNSVRLFLTAGLAKELVDITLNMAKLSGTVEGVEKAFARLPNSTLLMESLRKATRGTVNDLELMQKALMASNFRIPLEKLGTLLEFAAVKAQQTGQEVNHLVNYIVSGIGYRSIKRLDDLGFTANRVKEALGGVSLQAATMQQVMDAVTKLMQEDLEKTGGFAVTAATKVGQIETKYHELRVLLAQKFENNALLDFFKSALDGAKDLVESMPLKELKALFSLDWKKIHPVFIFGQITDVFEAWRQGLEDVAEQHVITNNAVQEAERIQKRIGDLTLEEKKARIKTEVDNRQKLLDSYFYELQALEMGGDKYSERAGLLRLNTREVKETVRILNEYQASLIDTTDDETKHLGIIAKKRLEIEKLQEQIEDTTRLGDLGRTGILTTALKEAQEELEELLGKELKKKKDDAAKRQRENDKRSFEHWKYYDDLRRRKLAEAEQEEIELLEDAAAKKREIAEKDAKMREELQRTTLSLAEDLLKSSVELATTTRNDEIENIRTYYDEQIELAGDNERAQKEIRIKQERELEKAREAQKEREKKAASTRILIDGLVAIAKIFGDFGWPAGIVPASVMAGITAVNVAQVKKFAKGVIDLDGPGTGTSDSIPARLSKGESVITAKATRQSMGLLEAIQANRIDDRILKSIDFSGGRTVQAGLNDERIVGELKAIRASQYKLEEQAGMIYRVYTDDDGNKKRIRSKSVNG